MLLSIMSSSFKIGWCIIWVLLLRSIKCKKYILGDFWRRHHFGISSFKCFSNFNYLKSSSYNKDYKIQGLYLLLGNFKRLQVVTNNTELLLKLDDFTRNSKGNNQFSLKTKLNLTIRCRRGLAKLTSHYTSLFGNTNYYNNVKVTIKPEIMVDFTNENDIFKFCL